MKAKFLTDLDTELVSDKNVKWRLTAPLIYQSKILDKVVTVPEGFVTNFASVPRLPLAFLLAGDTAHRPATVHDFLYTCSDIKRGVADSVFEEAMNVAGVPWWRRKSMWLAVRCCGWSCKENKRRLNEKDTVIARDNLG